MNIKQFRSKGGTTRWANMTKGQRMDHIRKMTTRSKESRAINKEKKELSTSIL